MISEGFWATGHCPTLDCEEGEEVNVCGRYHDGLFRPDDGEPTTCEQPLEFY